MNAETGKKIQQAGCSVMGLGCLLILAIPVIIMIAAALGIGN